MQRDGLYDIVKNMHSEFQTHPYKRRGENISFYPNIKQKQKFLFRVEPLLPPEPKNYFFNEPLRSRVGGGFY